jgi:hypothetical protein
LEKGSAAFCCKLRYSQYQPAKGCTAIASSNDSDLAKIQAKLEHRILHGLVAEWEAARQILEPPWNRSLKRPLFRIGNLSRRLGTWAADKREITLARQLVFNHPWDSVREVLFHEMAHQLAEEHLGGGDEKPHGPAFQDACHKLRANPEASGSYTTVHEQISGGKSNPRDKILMRIQKLMALAQSQNRHEAEAAMEKAHYLIAKYNIDLLKGKKKRHFASVFLGEPALRHFREDYHLAHLLEEFYFVQGLWVSTYVLSKGKLGRVFEISGTRANIKIASYVYAFVKRYIDCQWTQYNAARGLNRYRKTDFAVGIIEGFNQKLEQAMHVERPPLENWDLVTIKDPLLEAYMNYRYPHTRSFRRNGASQDKDVLRDGMQRGKKLVIHKGISETRASGRLLIQH